MNQIKFSKTIKNKVLKNEWEFSSDRRMGYHLMHAFHNCFVDDFPKIFGVSKMSSVYYVKDGVTSFYYVGKEYDRLIGRIKERFSVDKKFLNSLVKLIYRRYGEYDLYAEKLDIDKDKLTNRKVLSLINRHRLIEEKMSAPFWIIFNTVEKIITDLLILNGLTKEDVAVLSLTARMTPIDQYKIDLYKCTISEKEKDFKIFLNKYAHLGVFDFMFEPKDASYHINQIKNLSKNDALKNIREIKSEYGSRKRNIEFIVKKNKHISHLINFFICFSDVKEWKNFIREKANFRIRPLMVYVSERVDLDLGHLSMLTYKELENILIESEIGVNRGESVTRFKQSCFIFLKNNLTITNDVDIINKFVSKSESIFELRGFVAFKGKARGVVRIIVGESDFNRVREGDVLVASTTRPDFLPVMKKTVAFITNEGGVLSHAAIVARELKKPCIIGTKIATKVLKDGDLVEVDANLGTVTILEKAK